MTRQLGEKRARITVSPDSVNVGNVVSSGGASGSTATGGALTAPSPPLQAVASSAKNSAEIKEKLEVKRSQQPTFFVNNGLLIST